MERKVCFSGVSQEFLAKSLVEATYKHKEGTATSYCKVAGEAMLPNRLSVQQGCITKVQKKGRMVVNKPIGQLIGNFTKAEESPYKLCYPATLRTQLFEAENYPQFLGWGTIGFTEPGKGGKITDNGDLLVIHSPDNWETLHLYLLKGMGKIPDTIEDAFGFVAEILEG